MFSVIPSEVEEPPLPNPRQIREIFDFAGDPLRMTSWIALASAQIATSATIPFAQNEMTQLS
jgi:hypothetical protein